MEWSEWPWLQRLGLLVHSSKGKNLFLPSHVQTVSGFTINSVSDIGRPGVLAWRWRRPERESNRSMVHGRLHLFLLYTFVAWSLGVGRFNIAIFLPPPPHGTTAPSAPGSPHYRGFTITLRHTTFGRTPLDKWSTRHRDLNLIAHNTLKRQTSMPPAGFETAIPATDWPQTHATDLAATGISTAVLLYAFIRVTAWC
jgi:hypothetical protein